MWSARIVLALLFAVSLSGSQQPRRRPDIHFVPTPQEVVDYWPAFLWRVPKG